MNVQPVVTGLALDDTVAWLPGGPVTVREYLGAARAVADALPPGDWVLNLCADRYQFAVLFAACLLAGKTSLQPASHAAHTLGQLARSYGGVWCVTDDDIDTQDLPRITYASLAAGTSAPVNEIPSIDADREVAILFTSGSTGLPQPHGKTWGQLVMNGRAEAQALGLAGSGTALVGTVPVQHSYGFESTFLLALHGGCRFWSGKP
ncbi:MAG: beta-hydroxyacyl-ACP dehydratase, partial [Burkholderiaceae bacterium]